jgi:hypothetical protein
MSGDRLLATGVRLLAILDHRNSGIRSGKLPIGLKRPRTEKFFERPESGETGGEERMAESPPR